MRKDDGAIIYEIMYVRRDWNALEMNGDIGIHGRT